MTRSTSHALPALAGLLISMAPPALALDCRNASTQADMAACAHEDFLAANGAQVEVMTPYTARLSALERRRWRKAQSAWIAWRTAQCEFETAGSAGGSAQRTAFWLCVSRLTRERSDAIVRLARCPEGDLACPGRKP